MNTEQSYHSVCLLIPTYNNAGTLANVLKGALAYMNDIIVVNDGSTDETEEILKSFPLVKVLSYAPNKGKGVALRKGFKFAAEEGYDFIIAMDSDGQHFTDDIPVFLEKMNEDPNALYIGARNLHQENMPGKSTFANKFSNFWFYVETGVKLPDTQSGFRLYPLHLLKKMRFFSTKYEFEIEVMVRASWKGIPVIPVPIKVYYFPEETRVSHFRPFKDFSRITVLNTVLVFTALLYIYPRNFLRFIFTKGNLRKAIKKHLFNKMESARLKAFSIGFGVFMGIVPIWGFQMMVALPAALLLRLNPALVTVASNISIPPILPMIIFLSFFMGRLWVPEDATWLIFQKGITLEDVQLNLFQYVTGSITLALVAGCLAGLLSYFTVIYLRKDKQETA
jgi:glycosyltransferase involved in cell wall biosynthesis